MHGADNLQGARQAIGQAPNQIPTEKTTNGIDRLRTHQNFLDAQGKAEVEAIKRKTMDNGKDQEGGKKLKATNLDSFFPSNVISNKKTEFQIA